MQNILKIIYDKSLKYKIINISDIEKIIDMLIMNKDLNEYISRISVQHIRSNNLASYSNATKEIVIYSNVVEIMINNIDKKLMFENDFEKILYKNLLIIQILLHEMEHANQEKISYLENNLESYLIRLADLIDCANNDSLYEYDPRERLAEIKSYNEIIELICPIKEDLTKLLNVLQLEKIKRNVRGYHYKSNNIIDYPLQTYFTIGQKPQLLKKIDWYSIFSDISLEQASCIYKLDERLKYGFPISVDEYSILMKELLFSSNQEFKNKILIKRNL